MQATRSTRGVVLATVIMTLAATFVFSGVLDAQGRPPATRPTPAPAPAPAPVPDPGPARPVPVAGSGEHQPGDLANCFAFSIDQVGRGNLEAGIERFDGCLADDYTFEFVFFEGGPSIVCPGPGCPIQEFSSRADMRARFANDFFVNAGYLATQHQILNLDVSQSGATAEVNAYIQANHFLPDNSVDIAWNDYSFTAVRDGNRWVVKDEVIVGTAFLNFQGAPVG